MDKSKVNDIINKKSKEDLLGILLELQFQSEEGYLDGNMIKAVADQLSMTETRVYEVVSYYAMLKAKPQARYVLKVCNSSPCHFSKSDRIIEILSEELGVGLSEPTSDGLFAYHFIPCVGACEIGPVIKIKDQVFGNLDEAKIGLLIEDLRAGKIAV